jgi:hypothetical protein
MSNNEQSKKGDESSPSSSASSESILYPLLNELINNGIHVDKNLRQPTYYSLITFKELKAECFVIISDLLSGKRVPLWLSQRIAWFYADEFFQVIINDLSLTDSEDPIDDEKKSKQNSLYSIFYFIF